MEGISVPAAILILQILLWIEDCDKDYGEILNDVCFEISEKLGMIHKVCKFYMQLSILYRIEILNKIFLFFFYMYLYYRLKHQQMKNIKL